MVSHPEVGVGVGVGLGVANSQSKNFDNYYLNLLVEWPRLLLASQLKGSKTLSTGF